MGVGVSVGVRVGVGGSGSDFEGVLCSRLESGRASASIHTCEERGMCVCVCGYM